MARLKIIKGPQSGQTISLASGQPEYVIGRAPTSAIVLADMAASRNHARITVEGDTFQLEDLGSANGTRLNQARLTTRLPLRQNDLIKIGDTLIEFHESDTEPGQASTSRHREGNADLQSDLTDSFVELLDEEGEDRSSMNLSIGADEVMAEVDGRSEDTSGAYRQALKKLTTLYKVSEAIGTVLDRNQVLEKIMDSIFEIFPQIDRGFIMLEDPGTGDMIPKVIRKRGAGEGEKIQISVSRTIVQTAYREKQSILSSNAMNDSRFEEGASILQYGIRSMMCSPLFIGDEKLGVIHVDTVDEDQAFTPEDLSLLQGIGRQAAISIKNAGLVQEIAAETRRRNSLQRYLSPDIADRVMKGEIDLKLGGDAKFGTVFFSDIIGFTSMSSQHEPELVVAKINRYFNTMIDIIFRYKGTINKFWGDAIMALWGLTAEPEDRTPQISGVEASIDMQNALFEFNQALIDEGRTPVWMGIGLNTGTFLAGNVGSEQQMEYTVIGNDVNMASRIESRATRGQIYISSSTFERVQDRVYAIKMRPTRVKGREEPIQIYSIRGFRDRDFNRREVDRLTIPVSYAGAAGTRHHGLLKGVTTLNGKPHLFAQFKDPFEVGSDIELEPALPELAKPGLLRCHVERISARERDEETCFFTHTLQLLRSSPGFDELVRGQKVIDATVEVDDIKRG